MLEYYSLFKLGLRFMSYTMDSNYMIIQAEDEILKRI